MLQYPVPLDPSRPAVVSVSTILLVLLATMEANEEGILDDVNPEFLHDFRVAVRRTRAALGQLRGLFPQGQTRGYRSEFAWLGRATGPARDMDVYLEDFPLYRRELPLTERKNLKPFRDHLLARREEEYRKLTRVLRTARYSELKESWARFLRNPSIVDICPPDGRRPVAEIAGRRIRKSYKKALREGMAITRKSPPEALHELRITCKKLRYLLEFFQSLYPRKKVKKLISSLKDLQDNLGEYQDLHVQGEALLKFAGRMEKEGSAPAATLAAMGLLISRKRERETMVRKDFAERFQIFTGEGNRRLFREILEAGRKDRKRPG